MKHTARNTVFVSKWHVFLKITHRDAKFFCQWLKVGYLRSKERFTVTSYPAMDLKNTEAAVSASTQGRSVLICPGNPDIVWDLTDNTIPWIFGAIVSIASPMAILLNALVIIAVRQRKELQKLSNILLSSLAVADLLVGAVSMPLSAAVDFLIANRAFVENVCILDPVYFYSMLAIYITTLYHLTLIAWERYVAVQKWKDYKAILTRSRVKKLAIGAWFASLLTMLPHTVALAFDPNSKFLTTVSTVMIFLGAVKLILIVYFYIMVYLGVRRRKLNQIRQVSALVTAKLEHKVAKTTGLMTAAVICSFVPSACVGILANVFPALPYYWVYRPTETLMQLNSIANPLIYCYRDRRFRNAVIELLRFRKPRAIHPADGHGTVRFVRRRNAFGSLKGVAEQQNIENNKARLARSASSEQAVVLNYPPEKPHEMMQKRSMSVPLLAKRSSFTLHRLAKTNSFCEVSQVQQPSTITIIATIHAERCREGSTRPKFPEEDAVEIETEKKRIRLTRSASCDPAVLMESARPKSSQKILKRSMSAPLLATSSSFRDGSQRQHPSSTEVTTATTHAKRRHQSRVGKRKPDDKELQIEERRRFHVKN